MGALIFAIEHWGITHLLGHRDAGDMETVYWPINTAHMICATMSALKTYMGLLIKTVVMMDMMISYDNDEENDDNRQ